MKIRGYVNSILAVLCVCVMAACSDDDSTKQAVARRSNVPLLLSAQGFVNGTVTRGSANAHKHSLVGKTVGVYILERELYANVLLGEDANPKNSDAVSYLNIPCVVGEDNMLIPPEDTVFYYPIGVQGEIEGVGIVAYYPYNPDYTYNDLINGFRFAVKNDQSSDENVAVSDFMYSQPDGGPGLILRPSEPIEIGFCHKFSCLQVSVKIPADDQMKCSTLTMEIDGVATATTCSLPLWTMGADGIIGPDTKGKVTSTAAGITAEDIAKAGSDSIVRTFTFIVVPESSRKPNATTFSLSFDDKRIERADGVALPHKGGYVHRYSMRIDKDELTFTDLPYDPDLEGL